MEKYGLTSSVSEFWKKNREFPILEQAGMMLALCQSNFANTERIFSALGRICTPSRNRLSIDSMAHLLSILIQEPNSRPSRATRKHIAANDNVIEADFGTDELGGLLSEPSILDAESFDDSAPLTDDSRMFENTSEYSRFESLIDFDLQPSSEISRRERGGNRSPLDQGAQRVAERLVARRRES